jgi:hypothetical protein
VLLLGAEKVGSLSVQRFVGGKSREKVRTPLGLGLKNPMCHFLRFEIERIQLIPN